MFKKVLITTSISLSVVFGISGCLSTDAKSVKSQMPHQAHWGYTGHNTPDTWGNLSPKFRECGVGLNQSPINITNSLQAGLSPLMTNFNSSSKDVINNGHTIEVEMDKGSHFTIDGKEFDLKQFHFHSPSENHINNQSFPMEAHFVTADKDGNLAVIALMFKEGAKNPTLDKIWQLMPQKEGEKNPIEIEGIAQALLPADKHYYRFNGSLTTPPCSEGVRWFVLKTPVEASKDQIEKFKHTMHHDNNRPVQPINARVIVE